MKSSPAHAICKGSPAALGLVVKQIYISNIKAKSHSTYSYIHTYIHTYMGNFFKETIWEDSKFEL